MARFSVPTFVERAAASRDAKERALQRLRSKAVPDETAVAARAAAREARDAARAERQADYRSAIEERKAAREASRVEALATAERAAEARRPAPPPSLPSAGEMKAARDARYAARKARQ